MTLKDLIKSDLTRCVGNQQSFSTFLRYLYSNPGFKFIFFYRVCVKYSRTTPIGFLARFFYNRFSIKYGFQIPPTVSVGKGLLLPHFGFVVVNGNAEIGSNCNILQGVTIGNTKGGKNPGNPVIGNNVYIGPSATIVGKISIGNNVLVAPNAYVNFDVPENSIVLGNPAKVIQKANPTQDYINNISI
ncbi:serine acetyltransferase [Sphingobacterium alkalisoli]|uniref:Serine acetyltransferase n=1 Tax=Sphingobacterium alkalisoli TaxID=1874115 RepID=A0A4U0GMS6_9SPHI|nr:serine O-acetyltransferase [Sphingobacterium alkalisoli]TJY60165.1 serine acetyltransferase [Sphingobacterium alkalisoli]GGH32318.1 serine acetyltransferase [Sphingobacterium alkalisoli]